MKDYLKKDEWNIIEEGFHQEHNRVTESIFSIGNGRMGQRANFEEFYSGDSLSGNYVAGIYYPDKTRVGWWKNGYPDYFAKVLNAANWIGINIKIDGEVLDLNHCEIHNFLRVLNMKEGYLERSFEATLISGKIVKVKSRRFCSIVDDEVGAMCYGFQPVNFSGKISVEPFVDGDVRNEDANFEEQFWNGVNAEVKQRSGFLTLETRKTAFQVCTGMQFQILKNGEEVEGETQINKKEKYIGCAVDFECEDGDLIAIYKYAANLSSENHSKEDLAKRCQGVVTMAAKKGFEQLMAEQKKAWADKWAESDIVIEGDIAAQQGIRFNVFQLNQTYTGEDEKLNIGPKGFTGEKYGGGTYWDTEAYCLPFYLATADTVVAKNLLIYRYRHLEKAIENAAKLGFKDGAALYPMVTMNGEECHNEWEITFEEVHRNGAIAFAIYDYIRYTGDKNYLCEYGLEVLISIARFWAQRVHYSEHKKQYVMHGVTGPNEYENNVNNNWYTTTIAMWCLEYAIEAIDYVQKTAPDRYTEIEEKIKFYEYTERNQWKKILENMYLSEDKDLGIFLQQDGYLEKEQRMAKDLPEAERPISQHWSWDRILRSCFIKQADVLQGIYLLEDRFDEATIRRNFEYYEPRTVHESSLSPCVHVILAARLRLVEKAYELYLRTARLDLDDYNNDTSEGCHITSMAGTWMSIVKGFGGMRVKDDLLTFDPIIPKQWVAYSFKICFREQVLQVKVNQEETKIINQTDQLVKIEINGIVKEILPNETLLV